MLRWAFASFSDCLDTVRFNAISAKTERSGSLFSFAATGAHEDLHRLKTMAKLGENLFQIQVQIEEYSISHETLTDAARQSHAQGALSENDLYIMYRRIKETELQKTALAKSERIIRVTLTGLENQATIAKMRKVLTHTVHQHKMVHENGMLENASEKLMESFEQVSQHIAQGQSVLDNMDAQNDDIQADMHGPQQEIAQDTHFSRWKQELANAAAAPGAPAHAFVQGPATAAAAASVAPAAAAADA